MFSASASVESEDDLNASGDANPACTPSTSNAGLSTKLPFRYTVAAAPMVDQSDLAFRLLARRHGCDVTYTQMFMVDEYVADSSYRDTMHVTDDADWPCVVQLAGNEPDLFLQAALLAQERGCAAIDINLGCPQQRAKDGRYGSYMTDRRDWDLCCQIVATMAGDSRLKVPVLCKIRLQDTVEHTIEFAQRLQSAGCALLVVHGRKRGSPTARRAGPADLHAIAAVKAALTIPVIANGNMRCHCDVHRNLVITGCDGVMIGEGLLGYPAIAECPSSASGIDAQCVRDCCSRACCTPPGPVADNSHASRSSGAALPPPPPCPHWPTASQRRAVIVEYLDLAEVHRPPSFKHITAHVSWMLGRVGRAGHSRYEHRGGHSHADLRAELARLGEAGWGDDGADGMRQLRLLVDDVLAPNTTSTSSSNNKK